MGEVLIEEFLKGDSKEIRDLATNEAALVGFLTLAKTVDDLPDISSRFYEKSRSLYQVTATGLGIDELMAVLAGFFGPAVKPPGKSLPLNLRFDPAVKSLRGVRKDQALFLKKMKTGAFYGALWPWQRKSGEVEVLLGYCSPSISNSDYSRLGTLLHKFLSKKKIESISDVGGQIHGISLPSFLQMSEMEGATYTLRVTSANRSGYLYIHEGNLIAAEYETWTGNQAAYRIISWEKASIQIRDPDAQRQREIHEPLMHVMMESLKIKDEGGASASADGPPSPPDSEAAGEAAAPVPPEPMPAGEAEEGEAEDQRPLYNFMMQAPFEKPLDHSMESQRRMPRTTKLLIALAGVILLALAVTFGGMLLSKWQVNRRYDQLITELAATRELDAQVVRLMEYIQAYPQDVHRAELERRIQTTNLEIEKRDYEKTLADVNQLPVDERYEMRALSLYTAFLRKHPESRYVEAINQAKAGIGKVLSAASFTRLATAGAQDVMQRYQTYRDYLERFPDGEKRDAVQRMLGELAGEYAQTLAEQAAGCDAQKSWESCIAECDRFLSMFAEDAAAEAVAQLRRKLVDKQELAALVARADQVADDFAQAKRVYSAYLASHPQTTQKAAIEQRIAALDADLDRLAAWKRTETAAGDANTEIFARIQRLEAYIAEHGSGPYGDAARQLREQLEPQRQKALRARKVEAARRKALAQQQAEAAKRAEAARRLKNLQNQVAAKLQPVAERFAARADGTVFDRVTGLTWSLLDSQMALGKCLTHPQAVKYVKGLSTGGHTDWRLPTAGELGSIYKTKPFFPATGAAWYWSSQAYARGYHRVVDVVTSVPETRFAGTKEPEESCGAVRAVRK